MAPLYSRDSSSMMNSQLYNPRGDALFRDSIAFTATAGVFVAFRIGIRAKRKLLGWDDFWIGVAFIFSILLMVATIMSAKYGFGMRSDSLDDDHTRKALFWWYLNQIFYKQITWPTKISILLMYRRVFLVSKNIKAYGVRFSTLIWITLAVVVGCFISFQSAGIFQCTPVRRAWNSDVDGHCVDKMSRMYAYAGCNFVTDLFILLLPMPLICDMTHISKRQKVGLMAVFALGGFVCITTLLRISKLHLTTDVLYSGQPSVLWTIVEANIGIICACLPLMRSVIIYLIPWFADHTKSSRRPSKEHVDSGNSIGSQGKSDSQQQQVPNDTDELSGSTYVEYGDTESMKSGRLIQEERKAEAVNIETTASSTDTGPSRPELNESMETNK